MVLLDLLKCILESPYLPLTMLINETELILYYSFHGACYLKKLLDCCQMT